MDYTKKHKQAYQKILKANNILLITHERPDGDALSSLCAMIEIVTNLNKKFTTFCFDEPGSNFSFIPHFEKINSEKNFEFSKFDLIIILDCGSKSRTKLTEEINNKKNDQFIIEFDHHPKIDNYTQIEIRDPGASATTEILYDFIKINNIKFNKNLANCVLTGILTDTANFLYTSTTNKTLDISSEMLLYGAKFSEIVQRTWHNRSLPSIKLWGNILNNLTINKKYNVAFSVIKKDDLDKYEIDEDALDGVVGFLSNLHGVKFIIFLKEEEDGYLKGSLRSSHPDIDVSKLAAHLGGGGHAKASGFLTTGKLNNNEDKWKVI